MSTEKEILFIPFYYYPDQSAISQLFSPFINNIAASGYKVTVLSSNSRYFAAETNGDFKKHEKVDEVKIKTSNFGKGNIVSRLMDYVGYYFGVLFHLLFKSKKYKKIITLTQPPLMPVLVAFASLFNKKQYIYYVEDLYPDFLYDMGMLKNHIIVRFLTKLNNWAFKRAEKIVVISDYMKNHILKRYEGSRASKIHVIHNWPNINDVQLKSPDKKDDFTLMYSGNLGMPHDLSLLVKYLAVKQSDFKIRIIGGGRKYKQTQELFEQEQIENYTFEPYAPIEQVAGNLLSADLLLISQVEKSIGSIVPSKFYTYVQMRKPILLIGPKKSDLGEIILKEDIGIVIEDDKDFLLVDRWINHYKSSEDFRNAIFNRLDYLATKVFTIEQSSKQFIHILKEIK